jgi:hypothetical protein
LLSEERTKCEEPPPSLHGAETGSVGSRMPVRWGGSPLPVIKKWKKTTKKQYTDKKEKKSFLIYKEILKGAIAKSYMTNGHLIYD